MSVRSLSVSSRSALHLALGVGLAVAAPACLFPSYTFTEPEGAGGATTSSASQMTTSSVSSGGPGGASTTSTSTASSMTTTSTSTGMTGGEDCTNGVDDDGDGKIDCADSDCTVGFSCHNPVPAGWTGHYALSDGTFAGLPGNCPNTTYPNPFYTGYRTPNATPPSCSACSCGGPQGETCSVAQLHLTSASCAEYMNGTSICQKPLPLITDGACHVSNVPGNVKTCGPPDLATMTCPVGTMPCNASVYIDSSVATGGTCAPSAEVPNIVPFTWSNAARACQPTVEGKGCANDFACLPNAVAPFGAVCISKEGDNACPSGSGYTTKKVFFDLDPMDTRACSDCSCGKPTGLSCTTNIITYSDTACSAQLATTAPDGCSPYASNPAVGSYKSASTVFAAGSCAPSGGQPMGAAAPQNPVTFCCQ